MADEVYIFVRGPTLRGSKPTSNMCFDTEAEARELARMSVCSDGADREIWEARMQGHLAVGLRCIGNVGAC